MKYLIATLVFLVWFGAAPATAQSLGTNPTIPYPNPIKHVILIIQENRTPDNLFHALLTYPGINPANYDLASSGLAKIDGQQQVVWLTSTRLSGDYDLAHSHVAFNSMWDNGLMDGANLIVANCDVNAAECRGGAGKFLSYKYVQAADVDPYLQLVAQYGWANYMFQTNQGPSYVAHQILFSGTSAQTAEDDAEGILVAGNPSQPHFNDNYTGSSDTGCLAPDGEINALISPQTAPNTYTITNDPLGVFVSIIPRWRTFWTRPSSPGNTMSLRKTTIPIPTIRRRRATIPPVTCSLRRIPFTASACRTMTPTLRNVRRPNSPPTLISILTTS